MSLLTTLPTGVANEIAAVKVGLLRSSAWWLRLALAMLKWPKGAWRSATTPPQCARFLNPALECRLSALMIRRIGGGRAILLAVRTEDHRGDALYGSTGRADLQSSSYVGEFAELSSLTICKIA